MKHAILGLLARGWSQRRIARELGVSYFSASKWPVSARVKLSPSL